MRGPVSLLAIAGGILLITGVLWDAFETIVLPRTVSRRLRLARLYFGFLWTLRILPYRKTPIL